MADETEQSALEKIIAQLQSHGVEFVVIGGQAEILHGGTRVTFDVDICYRRNDANLERLAAALREMKPTLRGAPRDLKFVIDARSLALGTNFTFETTLGDFDLLGEVEPLGGFEAIAKTAETYSIGGVDVLVIALDDLIRVKTHIGRPKDRESLMQLLAIKRIRGESERQ